MNVSIHKTEMKEQHLLGARTVEMGKATREEGSATTLVWASGFLKKLSASPEQAGQISLNHLPLEKAALGSREHGPGEAPCRYHLLLNEKLK